MRTLITGGAGCLGANIVERLLASGDDVLVIDTFVTSARAALPDKDIDVVEGSVADRDLVDATFARFRPQRVIHAAASYKDPDDWAGDLAVNGIGSIHVVEAARRTGVGRFINLQTALCYGRPDATPIAIDAPLRPFTSYGVSKVAGEQSVLASGLNAVSLRIANVNGPRLAIGPIPTFYSRLKAGKACYCSQAVRDFLDLSDFLTLLDLALDERAPQGAFHASTGEGRTVREIYDAVARTLAIEAPEPATVPVGDDDVPAVVLDPAATQRAFGWRAQVSFEDSLRRLISWYDVHGVQAIYTHVRAPSVDVA